MTSYIELTEVWQEVATGACLIETHCGHALVHFGVQPPSLDSKAYHKIPKNHPGIAYAGAMKAFARRGHVETAIVVTEGG